MSVTNSKQQLKQRRRPFCSRSKYEAVVPFVLLSEPWYEDDSCPHHTICGMNKTTEATTEHLNTPAIWQSTYPSPIFEGALADRIFDLILKLPYQKKVFTTNAYVTKEWYKKNKAMLDADLSQIPTDNTHSLIVKRFAEVLETDPEKYFNGTYDWYFTGSGMDIVTLNGEEFLIHSDGNELQSLKISKLDLNSDSPISTTDVYNTKLSSLDQAKTIFEIKSIVNEPYFTVRQKHYLSIIHLSSNTLKLRKIHSDIPLVSSAVDHQSMKLILVDAKQHLQLFSLINEKPLSKVNIFENETTIDNWSSVRFVDPNQFLCVNRKYISVYDVRQPIETPVFCHDFTRAMAYCEDITCMEQSNDSYNTFIATTHKLNALDLRNYKDGKMPTFTWTHQLKTSPIVMDISKKDDKGELIAIGGIKSDDIKICDTTTIDNITISTHLPYTPLSNHDSFKLAKYGGNFLSSNCLLQHQIRQSNAGIKLKKFNSKKFSLLRQNTSGDVCVQQILHKEDNICNEIPPPNITKLTTWDENLRRKGEIENKLGFEATDITNFESLAAVFSSNMNKNLEKRNTTSPVAQKQKWEMSVEELSSYKDVLVNSLLDKWVITSDDVEMDVKYTDDRMNDWVDSTVQQYHIFEEDICVKSEPEMQEY